MNSDDKTVKIVTDRYSRAAEAQRGKIREWEQCRFMYRGDQWLVPQTGGGYASPSSDEDWRVRQTTNFLIANVESQIAVYLRSKPIIIATPSTEEDEDRKASKVSEKLLSHYWKELEIDSRLNELLLHVKVTGNGFLRPRWDAQAGKPYTIPAEDEDGEDTQGYEGEPAMDVFGPFSIGVEPGAMDLESCAWVIITETLLRHDVEERFDVKLGDEDSPDSEREDSSHDAELRAYQPALLDAQKLTRERVVVHTMYERPTRKHRKGQVVYCTPHTKLHVESELPPIGKNSKPDIPLIHVKDISLPDEFWATSSVSQAIPPQTGYNRKRSQMMENGNLMSRPGWIIEDDTVERGSISAEPGFVIWHDGTARHPPKQADIHRTPQADFSELGLFIDEINDIMSRHESSQGKQATNVQSGRHAAMNREADNSRLLPAIKIFEMKLGRFGKMLLILVKGGLKTEKTIHITGRSRMPEVMQFEANDISDTANISFEIASQLPWARESMQQNIIWALSQGLIGREQFFEMMEWPSMRSMYEPDQQHRLVARLENEWLKTAPVAPLATDDIQVHIQEHEEDLNNPDRRLEFLEMRRQYDELIQEWKAEGEALGVPRPQTNEYGNKILHLQQHSKGIEKPQPPPAAAKVNIRGEIPPEQAMQIAQTATAQGPPPVEEGPVNAAMRAGIRAPQPEQSSGGMATPPGGHLSGELYGPDVGGAGA